MARLALFAVSAFALVAGALGHARLVSPVPWNTAPTKTSPCGGSTQLPATATWLAGSTVTIQWQLIAGDGAGTVQLTLNTLGGSNPAGTVGALTTVSFSPPTTATDLRTYSFNYQVPAGTVCETGGCTLQVTSAGWVSCATVNIVSAGTEASISQPTSCTTTSGLTFCSMMNGKNVIIPTGSSAAELDTQASNTYTQNTITTAVFAHPESTACAADYKNFVCYSTFPLCSTTNGVCQDACTSMVTSCTLQPAHANLYNCATYSTSSCTDAAAVTPCCSPGQSFGIVILVGLIGCIVGLIGAMIYWRGANRPRYDAMMAKPGQWYDAVKSKFSK